MADRQRKAVRTLRGFLGAEPDEKRREIIERARADFYSFCRLAAPDFYRPSRPHLAKLCRALQDFWESGESTLILNLPPRHGKSRTACLFAEWAFGRKPRTHIMTGSYNERLSSRFAKTVRDGIAEEKADPEKIVYADIFPSVQVKRGDASVSLWALEGQYASYLATSPKGTATGFGCDLLILDDVIKNAYEAHNAVILDNQWKWFTDTMLSRLEEGGKLIFIMTRWAADDLAGRAIRFFTQAGRAPRILKMKALRDDGTMLCPEILSREAYERKTRAMGADIAAANYQQEPLEQKGRLYPGFRSYETLPDGLAGPFAYVDTADRGADSLCAVIWGVFRHEAYLLDVYYTKEPMERTEPELARRLKEQNVTLARIESNNGGRGFARAVDRLLKKELGWYGTQVRWFTQTKNKEARILTAAPWLLAHLLVPAGWRTKWPAYAAAMLRYKSEGRNLHDDAPDATTGIAETMQYLQEG